jgi:hypothetical protein
MAATGSNEGFLTGFIANSTGLASSQYKVVQLESTAGLVKVGTSATSTLIGVLQNDPAAGEEALVQVSGIARCLAEASVTIGSFVTCSSTGRAKTTTTSDHRVFGMAIDASGSAGDLIRVLLPVHFMYATT